MISNDHFKTTGVEKIRVRNEPIQARSSERIDALLNAAALVVAEVGVELLTTALVAEKSGASIGTVYRYFPDRIAVLAALSDRSIERYLGRVRDSLHRGQSSSWRDALEIAFVTAEEMHRFEPGFTSIRLGDLVMMSGAHRNTFQAKLTSHRIANGLETIMVAELGWPVSSEVVRRLEIVVTVIDSLLVRAFAVDEAGDPEIIDECTRVVQWYLRDVKELARAA